MGKTDTTDLFGFLQSVKLSIQNVYNYINLKSIKINSFLCVQQWVRCTCENIEDWIRFFGYEKRLRSLLVRRMLELPFCLLLTSNTYASREGERWYLLKWRLALRWWTEDFTLVHRPPESSNSAWCFSLGSELLFTESSPIQLF